MNSPSSPSDSLTVHASSSPLPTIPEFKEWEKSTSSCTIQQAVHMGSGTSSDPYLDAYESSAEEEVVEELASNTSMSTVQASLMVHNSEYDSPVDENLEFEDDAPPLKIRKQETDSSNNESSLTAWKNTLSMTRVMKNTYFIQDQELLEFYPQLVPFGNNGTKIHILEMSLLEALDKSSAYFEQKGVGQHFKEYAEQMKQKYSSYLEKKYISSSGDSFINDIPLLNEEEEDVMVEDVVDHVKTVLEDNGFRNINVEAINVPSIILQDVKKLWQGLQQNDDSLCSDSLRVCCNFLNDHGNFTSEQMLNDCLMFISKRMMSTGFTFTRDLQGRFSEYEPYSLRPDGECYSINYNDERKKDSFMDRAYSSDWYKIIIVPRVRISDGDFDHGLSLMVDQQFVRFYYHSTDSVKIFRVAFNQQALCTIDATLSRYISDPYFLN